MPHDFSPQSASRKVAIVTGAATGIGATIAIRLAKDGFAVVVSDLESQRAGMEEVSQRCQKAALEPHSLPAGTTATEFPILACDVSSEEQVNRLVDETVRTFGRLDCMVANAGIAKIGLLSDSSLESFNKIMSVNAAGTLLCYKAAAKAMIQCGSANGGRIIGASSLAGKKGFPVFGSYCASKFAIRALTQTAAMEYGPSGITVNAYAPGFISTPMVHQIKDAAPTVTGLTGDEFIDQIAQQSALKRIGTVEEIANVVSFLASDQSSFITGQCISIDGGHNFD